MSPRSVANQFASSTGRATSVERPVRESELSADAAEKGPYRHYMLKEIHEQPRAVANTLQERVANGRLLEAAFGPAATDVFKRTAARTYRCLRHELPCCSDARYFIEQICKVSVHTSRSRASIAIAIRSCRPNSLFVTISQSGETADTFAALRLAKQSGYLSTLAICNVPESSAGPGVGAGDVDSGRP